MPTDIPGIILAGGLSRRMGGGDKCLKTLGNQTVLAHVIARLRPQVSQLALNANGDPARFAAFDLPVLADPLPDHPGPLAGVLAGLDWAAEQGADAIVTAAADTPFFPADLVDRLSTATQKSNVTIALAATPDSTKGVLRHPTFGLWPTALRADLRHALQDGLRKIVLWTDRHNAAAALFDAAPFDPFFNLNTPEDMVQAERMLGAA
ncbi:MAG: molybdenum cofactor guanylyltransferase MobA [Rhodobacter sp.]|nr:molybdenum cofactor guanylyltransferase MobA [Rhodobacter sp.]